MSIVPSNPVTAPGLDPLKLPDPYPDPEWNPPPVPTDLIDNDGEPLETIWHRININLLTESIEQRYQDRKDFFVGGNMFVYFSGVQAPNRDYRGPDFFFVDKVSHEPMRRWWAIWDEYGRYPDVIVELISPTTNEDLTVKKDLYESSFRTPEYFCYDPDTQELLGWRRENEHYVAVQPNEKGWIWCDKLGLWLGAWDGVEQNHQARWLRFFHPNGEVVMTFAEAEKQRAEAEKQRADAAEQRVAALADEIARLTAQLAKQAKPQP